jgi:hypothetical protein
VHVGADLIRGENYAQPGDVGVVGHLEVDLGGGDGCGDRQVAAVEGDDGWGGGGEQQ